MSRLVVKIGSSLLVEAGSGLRRNWLASLATDIAARHAAGDQVIVVTSGAIAMGRAALDVGRSPSRLDEKQAAAAVGQIHLAHAYQAALASYGLTTAQVLLTLDDTENRRRYLNARATIEALLRLGAIPVVNENDTVATSEIRFGDNDRLSARVAVMTSADQLLLLSDVDGLYTANPGCNPHAVHIPHVEKITAEIEAMAGGTGSAVGTGGMVSKLIAAKLASQAGCSVILASGLGMNPLRQLENGARCTTFSATTTPRRARKHWIAASLDVMGVAVIDHGAAEALKHGRSLLPAGVTAIEGHFERGDPLLVRTTKGQDIAKGLSAYDADDARRIQGRRTEAIADILGYQGRDELIHRDDLVLL